eukprot:297693_1
MDKAITYHQQVDCLEDFEFDLLIKQTVQNYGCSILKQSLFHFFVNESQLFNRTDKVNTINEMIKEIIAKRVSNKNDTDDIELEQEDEIQYTPKTINDLNPQTMSTIASFLIPSDLPKFEKTNRYIFISCRKFPLSVNSVTYSYAYSATVGIRKCNKYYLNRYKMVKELTLKLTSHDIYMENECDDIFQNWVWNNISKLNISSIGEWYAMSEEDHELFLNKWNTKNLKCLNNVKEFNLHGFVLPNLQMYFKYVGICPNIEFFNFGGLAIESLEDDGEIGDPTDMEQFDEIFSDINIKNHLVHLRAAQFYQTYENKPELQSTIFTRILNNIGDQLEFIAITHIQTALQIDENIHFKQLEEIHVQRTSFHIGLVRHSRKLKRVRIQHIRNKDKYDEILKYIMKMNSSLEYLCCCGYGVYSVIMNNLTKLLNDNQTMYKSLKIRISENALDNMNDYVPITSLINTMDKYTKNDLMFICSLCIYDNNILSKLKAELNALKVKYLIQYSETEENNDRGNYTEYHFIIGNRNSNLCYGVAWKWKWKNMRFIQSISHNLKIYR